MREDRKLRLLRLVVTKDVMHAKMHRSIADHFNHWALASTTAVTVLHSSVARLLVHGDGEISLTEG